MVRSAMRRVSCDPAFAVARLEQADAFALAAGLHPLSQDGPTRSVAVSNAVLAGIAAADVICCRSLGERSAGSVHAFAAELLKEVPLVGSEARSHLRSLLAIKNMAQYQAQDPSLSETKRALRAMEVLIRIARSL